MTVFARWCRRHGHAPEVTIFARWDRAPGIAVGAFLSSSFLALLGPEPKVLAALLACAAISAGFRYRVIVSRAGIECTRAWLVLRWHRRRFPLTTQVEIWSSHDDPEGDGVAIGDIVVALPPGEAEALRRVLLKAIARARGESPGG